jgi:eukaryotic-like serine/threonine-protein kinase
MPSSTSPSGRRYEPIAQIGRGGMAEVLLTMVHAGGGVRRLEVLKRIWPELATDPDFVTMFLDEARLSLRLNHANVVQTYEVLSGGGQLAIAMEYLDGQPLTRVLNRLMRGSNALSLPLRLRVVTSVLAGLEHAHTLTDLDGTPLEVVHRDVSPQNVFVTYDGRVKLVDFGVAKTLAASHHTRPGAIKGKLAYMAPEQLQCAAVDRRADLFAVGVMLWEILAGRRMWQGKTEVDIVSHLANGRQFPPLPLDANLPTALDTICMRALDPDPESRYQTAAEFEMELERVLVGVADSHARHLGKVVSMAFEAERAERQAVIERALRGEGPLPTRATPATPLPAITAVTSLTPVTRVTPPAALAARSARGELPGIDITVGSFQVGPATSFVKRPSKPTNALRWWRGVALASLAATSCAAVLLLAAWRRPPVIEAPVPRTVFTTLPPLRGTSQAESAAAARGAPRAAPQAPSRAVVAAGRDGTEHHRRHRRVELHDEDAPMPPSTGAGDQP